MERELRAGKKLSGKSESSTYYMNILDLAEFYVKAFRSGGLTNFRFVVVPASRKLAMSEVLVKTPSGGDFVEYRYPNPSPLFTRPQIDFIESVHSFLLPNEIEIVSKLERFVLNVNTGIAKCDVIPGLRENRRRCVYYIRRFSSGKFLKMMNSLLDLVVDEMIGREIRRTMISPFRVRFDNGDIYYPITLNEVIVALRPKLLAGVAHFNAKTAQLDRGKFVLASGEIIPLSAVEIDRAERDYPDDW